MDSFKKKYKCDYYKVSALTSEGVGEAFRKFLSKIHQKKIDEKQNEGIEDAEDVDLEELDFDEPSALNFGRPNPTIEIITPALFFLNARSCLQTSPPFLWLPDFFEDVFPSMHHTVPSSLSLFYGYACADRYAFAWAILELV